MSLSDTEREILIQLQLAQPAHELIDVIITLIKNEKQ